MRGVILLIALLALSFAVSVLGAKQLRFDVYLAICPKEVDAQGPYCPSRTPGQLCFCDHDFKRINSQGNHYISVTDDGHQKEIEKAGNSMSYYVNRMNDVYYKKKSGKAFGAALYKEACQKFDGCKQVPKWWILNEISASKWAAANAKYQQYVVDLTAALKAKKLNVIVAAPFDEPKRAGKYWKSLAKLGYIGIENYVSGKELKEAKFSMSWLKAQYKKSITAFAKFGVPKSRLFVFESYGSTLRSKVFGRAGITPKEWVKTIKMRAVAIKAARFKGFIGYGWWGNQMKETWQVRDKYYDAYLKTHKSLP
jgi:hypothetical protein